MARFLALLLDDSSSVNSADVKAVTQNLGKSIRDLILGGEKPSTNDCKSSKMSLQLHISQESVEQYFLLSSETLTGSIDSEKLEVSGSLRRIN